MTRLLRCSVSDRHDWLRRVAFLAEVGTRSRARHNARRERRRARPPCPVALDSRTPRERNVPAVRRDPTPFRSSATARRSRPDGRLFETSALVTRLRQPRAMATTASTRALAPGSRRAARARAARLARVRGGARRARRLLRGARRAGRHHAAARALPRRVRAMPRCQARGGPSPHGRLFAACAALAVASSPARLAALASERRTPSTRSGVSRPRPRIFAAGGRAERDRARSRARSRSTGAPERNLSAPVTVVVGERAAHSGGRRRSPSSTACRLDGRCFSAKLEGPGGEFGKASRCCAARSSCNLRFSGASWELHREGQPAAEEDTQIKRNEARKSRRGSRVTTRRAESGERRDDARRAKKVRIRFFHDENVFINRFRSTNVKSVHRERKRKEKVHDRVPKASAVSRTYVSHSVTLSHVSVPARTATRRLSAQENRSLSAPMSDSDARSSPRQLRRTRRRETL